MADATPVDALSVLADETRLEVLRALAEAERALSFSELRKRAGVDDSGRFNYHLERLCEYFIRETADGYELGHTENRMMTVAGIDGEGATHRSHADDNEPAVADDSQVRGESGCGSRFHLHLSLPWR